MSLTLLPYNAALGAEVDIAWDTTVNTSESSIAGRGSRRSQPIRNFHLTIGPDEFAEVYACYAAMMGRRFPIGVRDWIGGFEAVDEPIDHFIGTAGTEAELAITYTPATGSRSFTQRILCPDETNVDLEVKVNGSPVSFDLVDPGIVVFSGGLGSGDSVTWSGQYVFPCCFTTDSTTTKILSRGDNFTVRQFTDLQLTEILEDEFVRLMAE